MNETRFCLTSVHAISGLVVAGAVFPSIKNMPKPVQTATRPANVVALMARNLRRPGRVSLAASTIRPGEQGTQDCFSKSSSVITVVVAGNGKGIKSKQSLRDYCLSKKTDTLYLRSQDHQYATNSRFTEVSTNKKNAPSNFESAIGNVQIDR